MATISRSDVLFVGGPYDGSEYFAARGVSAFPHHLHLPHGGRLHMYRLQLQKKSKRLTVRFVHTGIVMPDGATID